LGDNRSHYCDPFENFYESCRMCFIVFPPTIFFIFIIFLGKSSCWQLRE
jgi:hypothetical protein